MSLHLNNNNLFLRQNILKNMQRNNAEGIQEKEDSKEKGNNNSLEVVDSQKVVEEDNLDLVITASADIIMENINKALLINKPNAALNPKIDIVSLDSGKPVIDNSCRVIDENANSGDEKKDLFTDLLKQMFGENNTIDAKYLSDNLNNWNEGGDAEIKDFMTIIKNVMDKMGFKYHYDNSPFDEFHENFRFDFQEFFEAMIKTINDEVGVENAKPPVLSQETLKRFNQGDILNEINDLLNSDEFKKNYYLDIDGEIDDFSQGTFADCWLMSGINALNLTEKGRQALKDAIKDNGDGTYTVNLKEYTVNEYTCPADSITITYEDIVEARKSGLYSHGDTDVLLLEIAFKQYNEKLGAVNGLGAGGAQYAINAILEGYIKPEFHLSNEKLLEYKYDDFKDGNMIFIFNFHDGHNLTDVNGKQVELRSDHAYSIVDMYKDPNNSSNNTVTIIDPYSPDKPIVLTWDEFDKVSSDTTMDCFCSRETITVDDLFAPLLNGDVKDANTFCQTIRCLSYQGALTDEQKNEIVKRAEEINNNPDKYNGLWINMAQLKAALGMNN